MKDNKSDLVTVGTYAKNTNQSRQNVYKKIERGTFDKKTQTIGGVLFVVMDK